MLNIVRFWIAYLAQRLSEARSWCGLLINCTGQHTRTFWQNSKTPQKLVHPISSSRFIPSCTKFEYRPSLRIVLIKIRRRQIKISWLFYSNLPRQKKKLKYSDKFAVTKNKAGACHAASIFFCSDGSVVDLHGGDRGFKPRRSHLNIEQFQSAQRRRGNSNIYLPASIVFCLRSFQKKFFFFTRTTKPSDRKTWQASLTTRVGNYQIFHYNK